MKKRIKALSFHTVFGNLTVPIADLNLDASISNPDQNNPNPQWGCPAYIEGCTYYTQTEVNQDKDKMLYSPTYQGTWSTYMEDQPIGAPVDVADAINTPTIYGLLAYGETTQQQAQTRLRVPYEVKPLNGSLYQGIVSALQKGYSVSFMGIWYESFDNPMNGVVPSPSGNTSEHNWKFCGVKNGLLIAKPWLGKNWGDGGFCYMSQQIVDGNGGQAFTFAPADSTNAQVRWETIVETLIRYMKRLASLEGGTQPIMSLWTELEDEEQLIQQELINLVKKPMPPESQPIEVPIVTVTHTEQPPIVNTNGFHPMIVKWAGAITHGEGASPSSNNPGNLKFSTLTKSWGATQGRAASDGGFLCQFSNPQQGLNALCDFLTLGAEDLLVAFHQARTLREFTVVYAGNPPEGYIETIIEIVGVPGDTIISTFIN